MTSQEMFPELYTLKFYIKQSIQAFANNPKIELFQDLIGDYNKWKSKGYEKLFENPKPWMASAAVRFFEKIKDKKGKVFEYGSGASTVFMAERFGEITSVEHEESWQKILKGELETHKISNVEYIFKGPEPISNQKERNPANPEDYCSIFEGYNPFTFKAYASEIDRFPDQYFDIIIVDGRVRPSCMKHSWPKLKKGGYLVLDNSDRPHYKKMHNEISGQAESKVVFFGPVAQNPNFQETTFWKK
jgi:hypothetical protein